MKLVVFDVDGTLVDSQNLIHQAMTLAFEGEGHAAHPLPKVLETVGLSLPVAIAQLAPDLDEPGQARIVEGYRQAFLTARISDHAPLYPGARACIERFAARDDLVLAIATGKAMRGLLAMIEHHGFAGHFASLQCADGHPSKPHPAMLHSVLADTGIDAKDALMIGDTTFDIRMGIDAGMAAFGVDWGYHPAQALREAGAALVAPDYPALTASIEDWIAGKADL